jgi:hypothetical protein|tara:strand:+ start:165 stop:464 length:300 start_codon:yes stop_codon:yes gene_type:complete
MGGVLSTLSGVVKEKDNDGYDNAGGTTEQEAFQSWPWKFSSEKYPCAQHGHVPMRESSIAHFLKRNGDVRMAVVTTYVMHSPRVHTVTVVQTVIPKLLR